MSARVLVTGFGPFGSHVVNPSERMVRRLARNPPRGVVFSSRVLPVTYSGAFAPVREVLHTERLHAVVLMGLNAGAERVIFERLAVNWRGSALADNDGVHIAGAHIDPGGPAAYFGTLPADDLVTACQSAGAPAATSNHAGTFICNQVLYQTLRHCDRHDLRCMVGFVHLPYLPEQADDDEPSLDEDTLAAGLTAALDRLAAAPRPGPRGTPPGP